MIRIIADHFGQPVPCRLVGPEMREPRTVVCLAGNVAYVVPLVIEYDNDEEMAKAEALRTRLCLRGHEDVTTRRAGEKMGGGGRRKSHAPAAL
jgi:hypothetical protein